MLEELLILGAVRIRRTPVVTALAVAATPQALMSARQRRLQRGRGQSRRATSGTNRCSSSSERCAACSTKYTCEQLVELRDREGADRLRFIKDEADHRRDRTTELTRQDIAPDSRIRAARRRWTARAAPSTEFWPCGYFETGGQYEAVCMDPIDARRAGRCPRLERRALPPSRTAGAGQRPGTEGRPRPSTLAMKADVLKRGAQRCRCCRSPRYAPASSPRCRQPRRRPATIQLPTVARLFLGLEKAPLAAKPGQARQGRQRRQGPVDYTRWRAGAASRHGASRARRAHGTMQRAALLKPSIEPAEKGQCSSRRRATSTCSNVATADFKADPATAAIFLNKGEAQGRRSCRRTWARPCARSAPRAPTASTRAGGQGHRRFQRGGRHHHHRSTRAIQDARDGARRMTTAATAWSRRLHRVRAA